MRVVAREYLTRYPQFSIKSYDEKKDRFYIEVREWLDNNPITMVNMRNRLKYPRNSEIMYSWYNFHSKIIKEARPEDYENA